MAVLFTAAVVVALVWNGVPAWDKHGVRPGPLIIRRAADPSMYFWLTTSYAAIAAAATFFAFFRFPWVTILHLRLLVLATFVLLLAFLLLSFTTSNRQDRAQVAWKRIEELGGKGVWESDMVVVSLANTGVRDGDLALFDDFPDVEILDLSKNRLTDDCLRHLNHLESLEELILIDTSISADAIAQFRTAHPKVNITTESALKGANNPFTGKPLDGVAN